MPDYVPMQWTPEMDQVVADGVLARLHPSTIASTLQITSRHVSNRMEALGLGHGSWANWEIDILRREWPTGLPASQIAKLLAPGRSRNAVIGKAHRLKLGSRIELSGNAVLSATSRPKPSPKRKRQRGSRPSGEDIMKKIKNAPIRIPENKPISTKPPISILELTKNTCKAIVGSDAKGLAVYCGDQTFAGKSFCEGHCALYFDYDRKRRYRS